MSALAQSLTRRLAWLGALGPERRKEFGIKKDAELLDPDVNGRAAHRVWADTRGSWRPWSTYLHGTYLRFVERAQRAVDLRSFPPGRLSCG